MPRITPDDVRAIADMDDQPVLRNLLITQTYADISSQLSELVGRRNLNWCAYATWASKTAGTFIREDEVPKALRNLIERAEHKHSYQRNPRERAIHECRTNLMDRKAELQRALCSVHPEAKLEEDHAGFLGAADDVVHEIAAYIRTGNKIVFAELGGAFAGFLQTFGEDTSRDDGKLQRFLERFDPGPTLPDEVRRTPGGLESVQRGGQSLLRESMAHYYDALFESDPNRKAELLLLANAQGGLHEQTRLQTYIQGSLDIPVKEFVYDTNHRSLAQRLDERVLGRAHVVLDRLLSPITDDLLNIARELSTELLMTMPLPNGTLRLGEDIPAAPGQMLWPRDLEKLENDELIAVMRQYGAYDARETRLGTRDRVEGWLNRALVWLADATPVAQGTAAKDWAQLSQRMRFIFEYFRSRQQDAALFAAPFSAQQEASIRDQRLPEVMSGL